MYSLTRSPETGILFGTSQMNPNTPTRELSVRHDRSLMSSDDLYLFNEGRNYRAYHQLGARLATVDGEAGTNFAVWAPNARKVSVVGDFNGWNNNAHLLES